MSDNVSIVYDWPEESHVSHNFETGKTTIYIQKGEADPAGVVRRSMAEIRRRGWA